MLEMDTELKAREQRLKGIIHSRAWKLAAPLRDVERFVQRMRSKPSPGSPATTDHAAQASPQAGAPESPVNGSEPARPAYAYTFNFDHPRTWNTASNKLLILGWCYENSGAPIRGIRAQFAGQDDRGIYGSKRLDVLASTGMKQAEYCGIKIDVPHPPRRARARVEVQHDDGWHPYFQTLVRVGKAGDPTELSEYEKWCQQHETLEPADRQAIRSHIAALRGADRSSRS